MEMPKQLNVSVSPHITDSSSTQKLMLNVIIALLPTAVASVLIFGWRALLVTGITTASAVVFEALYCKIMKKPLTIGDLSAVVTGIILAFNLPVSIPLWMAVIGAFAAIVITKQLFGGLGYNFANPALVGRMVLFVGFTSRMTSFTLPQTGVDALTTATPLATEASSGASMFWSLFLGQHGGALGETCAFTLLLGGIYLIVTKTIRPTVPLVYIGTVVVLSLLTGHDLLIQLMGGGLFLGAFFMATDYVTCPFTRKGQWIYGLGLGLITCLIRFYGNMTEGVSFALLFMNLLVPYLNNLTRQKPLGGEKRA